MQLSCDIDILVDFASQIEYANHPYVQRNQSGFALTKNKTTLQNLTALIQAIIASKQLDEQKQIKVRAAIHVIELHLNQKITGLFSLLNRQEDNARINQAIQDIQQAKQKLKNSPFPLSEAEARLKFYAGLSNKLSVKNAATNDLEGIKAVSRKIWEMCKEYENYEKYMIMFFEGEHFLFEENDQTPSDDFSFYEELKGPHTTAYLRGSSHYDHGTTNGKAGGPPPNQQDIERGVVKNPQYEIAGPQVKALLFGRVKLALDPNGKPIFGKAFDQICEAAKAQRLFVPVKFRKYTFLQAEWAPDGDSIWTINFWKHRILSCGIYKARKLLSMEKPNVGPYGYGHADTGKEENSHPTVIRC